MWRDVPERVLQQIDSASSAEDIVDSMLGDSGGWPPGLPAQLMHPAGAVAAVLALARPGMTALDLGTGWPALATALTSYGVTVTSADFSGLRLKFEQLMHDQPSAATLHLEPDDVLPWQEASFDRIFVDLGELEEANAGIESTLREVRRVLAEDGAAVVALPRGADVTYPRLRRLLSDLGLHVSAVFIPRPSQHGWTHLVPHAAFRRQLLSELSSQARGPLISKQTARRVLARLGAMPLFPRDRYLVVQSDSSMGPAGQLAELLDEPTAALPTILSLSDARVALIGQEGFVKLPLSAHQQQAVVQEAENTRLARRTAFAPYTVDGERICQRESVSYVRYPLLAKQPVTHDAAGASIAQILRTVGPGASAPLRSTAFWSRLGCERGAADAADVGASAAREWVLSSMGDVVLPVGPTHGDLHADNLIMANGQPFLVDWNRFELTNPLLLDAGYATVEHHRRAHDVDLAGALARFRTGTLSGPLADHADQLFGGLSRDAGTWIVLLDRIVSYSLPRRRHKPWTVAPLQAAVASLPDR